MINFSVVGNKNNVSNIKNYANIKNNVNKPSELLATVTIILINLQVNTKETILIDKNTIIELIYDEDQVLQASRLFDAGAVTNLASLDANLYLCKVKDGKIYDVEIQSPFAKKQKASCECAFFINHRMCKHVIAGLMLIRADKNTKQTNKENKAAAHVKQKLATLNINQILEEISHDELISFVKSYSKKDPKFSTQLKVSFARKIDTTDNAEKYKTILNSVVRPHTGENTKANASDIKTALRVLEDFADQVNDCIALGQYREALDIYCAAFAKLEYVRHYYTYHSESLTALSIEYHKTIAYFLSEKLPPELRTDLLVFLNDLANRSYYHYVNINFNIVKLITPYVKPSDHLIISEGLEKLISARSNKELPILLSLWLINQGKYSDESWQYIKEYNIYHIEIVDQLLEAGEELLALKVLESMNHPKKVNKDVVNRLVFLYVRFKKTSKLTETASIAYIQSGDLKYIDIVKRELTEDAYIAFIEKLEQDLKAKNADPNLLIRIFRKEENWAGLLLYLDRIGDIDFLMQHDAILYKYEKKALVQLYIHLIRQYLDETIGDTAFDFLTSLKSHWTREKMENVILNISKFIKEEYGHRPKLADVFA